MVAWFPMVYFGKLEAPFWREGTKFSETTKDCLQGFGNLLKEPESHVAWVHRLY